MNARACLVLVAALAVPPVTAQDDLADVPHQDLTARKDKHKRYFLVGPVKGAEAPKGGYGLVVVMPGGPGTADFLPFVKRLYRNALPDGYLVAQPVAFRWEEGQEIVWPTAKNKVGGMKFSTEEFVGAVLDDVGARHKLDPARVFTLSWSSSGPAGYAASLSDKRISGSFVAMSVYKPDLLPDLKAAKGRAYFLYHSEDDRVCPHRMAVKAEKDLKAAGAAVRLENYEGGHGWRGPVYADVCEGFRWLEKNAKAPGKP